jgi:flagellar biosynthesis protein FlhB
MEEALIVFIVFGSMTVIAIVIGLAIYFAKRLEHKQIMTAIEKGTPLSELRRLKPMLTYPEWIKYLTGGIIILAVAFAFGFEGQLDRLLGGSSFVAIILCGVGISLIVRGLLHRKYCLKNQVANNNSKENKSR